MKKAYGKIISNLVIDGEPAPYPVVNERSIRATAGIMFAIGFATFFYIFLTGNYTPLYIVVPLFWLDFLLKSLINPSWSIFDQVGRLIVRKQKPEYVGAIQKRFAWSIGLVLATAMMIIAVVFHIRGPLPFAICLTCLFFMWLESAAGICVGCKIYSWLLNKQLLSEPTYRPVCPGGVCSLQKQTSL